MYCEKLQEFHKIIHNRELLKKELFLEVFYEMGKPAVKFNLSFFLKYSLDPSYVNIISQFLNNAYYVFIDYCEKRPMGLEEMKDVYCDCISQQFRINGVC